MHQSVATIDSPEFINLQPLDINPLMSQCEIKVFYLGENRNHSYITKEVAYEMAKTLRGAPIVGYYKEENQDFRDHGDKVVIDDEGVHFQCQTKPYGFVAPDAKVWFQKFEDYDDFGNAVVREYLMTTGFLWTGQYEECKSVVEGEGKPHSMELDENTLQGHWAENNKNGMEFFIINDAIFSKLCILGDDVEPCFEGSSVSAPKVSSSFALDDNFKKTLFTMMQELQTALKGGMKMSLENETLDTAVDTEVATVVAEETEISTDDTVSEEILDNSVETPVGENQEVIETPTETFEKKDDEEEEPKETEEDKDKEEDKKFELLSAEHEALKQKYSQLQEDYNILIAFKQEVEDAKKDEMISNFYMLSDEDKKEVIENKSKYSLAEIESKLSVIFAKKSMAEMSAKEVTEETKSASVTFSLDDVEDTSVPAWISAIRNTKNSKQD